MYSSSPARRKGPQVQSAPNQAPRSPRFVDGIRGSLLYFSPMVESHGVGHNVAVGARSGERRSLADGCCSRAAISILCSMDSRYSSVAEGPANPSQKQLHDEL